MVETIGEIQFLKNILLVEIDFLVSGNHFFLQFSDTPVTNSFIFLSNGNVFLNKSCIPVSGFLVGGNPFFIYFSDIPASSSFFAVYWKRNFESNPSFRFSETIFLAGWNQLFKFLKYLFHWK